MNITRKLASIQKIISVEPILGADRIEKLTVLGWELVSQKGNFKPGDLGIFFEPDSLLPTSDPRFTFLDKDAQIFDGERRFRLRVIKLRKQVSSGLMLPLTDFPECVDLQEGKDVTQLLNIKLYESPAERNTVTKLGAARTRNFPTYLFPKTDEPRCQNFPNMFNFYKDTAGFFEVSEKLNGVSCSFYYKPLNNLVGKHCIKILDVLPCKFTKFIKYKLFGRSIGVCSRNLELDYSDDHVMWKIANQLHLEDVLPKLGRLYAFQGEVVGELIQKNPYKLKGQHFYLYNIFDIENKKYLTPLERISLLDKILYEYTIVIPHIPIIETKFKSSELESIQYLLQFAEGKSRLNKDVDREGLVFKRDDGEFSFKVISNKYLLNEKD